MRWVLVWATFVLGYAMVGGVGGWGASEAAGSAASMYRTEEVIGKVVSADAMYEVGTQTWYAAEIRIQERSSGPQIGSFYTVRYPFPTWARALAPSDDEEIKLVVHQASPTDVWTADSPPAIIDRGELLNPGGGAMEELGNPTARILIKMLTPLSPECHQKTAKLLRELAAKEPDRVRLQIFDMDTAAGRQEMNRERLSCATILVNNRYRFTIATPKGRRYVSLRHRPNETDSSYRSEDVIAVVEHELRRVYAE